MATPGYLPVPDDSARRAATERMRRARYKGNQAAVGGAVEPLHGTVLGVGDRMAEGGQPESRSWTIETQL